MCLINKSQLTSLSSAAIVIKCVVNVIITCFSSCKENIRFLLLVAVFTLHSAEVSLAAEWSFTFMPYPCHLTLTTLHNTGGALENTWNAANVLNRALDWQL
ncbi:hypothetical protein GOODEAATRI_019207 [Goodea atripinnis]|uniref:Uncharacterized protein n=1 Tax=Goodea atripinnis TaxID=208336 RepID=A0ABV0MTH7_9TELE